MFHPGARRGASCPELHGVPSGNQRPAQEGQGMDAGGRGVHLVITAALVGFCPVGKCKESSPG